MSKRGGRGKVHHKGRRRHFTDAEELQRDMELEKRKNEWRERKGEGSDEEGEGAAAAGRPESDSDEESDSEEEESKPKGVSGLIEIENPNRVAQKTKKASDVSLNDDSSGPQLSRREREEIAKQRNVMRQRKLQEEGKTDQAKSDLARLAIIKKQREEAARKREEQKKSKEAAEAAKSGKR